MLELSLTPAAPVLISTLGAAITQIAARFMPSRERDALALLVAGGALASTSFLAYQPASSTVISPWHPLALCGDQLTYTTEGLAAPFALLISLVCLAIVISLSKWRRESDGNGDGSFYPAVFAVLAAGLSFIYSGNLITLCLSWAFLDLSLLFLTIGRGRNWAAFGARGRALMMSSLTGLGLVVAALFLDDSGLSPTFAPSLFLLAALVRSSFYPLHFWMLAGVKPPANTLLQTVPIATGLFLLVRLQELSPQGLPYQSQLVAVGSLALVATALGAWAEQDRYRAISCIAANQVALAVFAAIVGSQARSSLLWSAISLALCLGLLNLKLPEPESISRPQKLAADCQIRRQTAGFGNPAGANCDLLSMGKYGLWLRVPTGLAVASLMGLPFTMGFVGRAALYRSLFALGRPYLWGLSMVADAALFAALFRIGADLIQFSVPNSQLSPWWWVPHLAGAIILAAPLTLLGIHPPLANFLAADVDLPAAAELVGQADLTLWAVLLLPPAGGWLLHRGQKAILEQSAAFWGSLAALLRLDWLYCWLWKIGRGVGAALRGLAQVTEGEGYLGWTLLLAFIAFLLLTGRRG